MDAAVPFTPCVESCPSAWAAAADGMSATATRHSSNRDRCQRRRPGSAVAYGLLKPSRSGDAPVTAQRRQEMLETIAIILIILWLLGLVSGYTMGNFIYILLVIAIVLFLVRLVSGRRV